MMFNYSFVKKLFFITTVLSVATTCIVFGGSHKKDKPHGRVPCMSVDLKKEYKKEHKKMDFLVKVFSSCAVELERKLGSLRNRDLFLKKVQLLRLALRAAMSRNERRREDRCNGTSQVPGRLTVVHADEPVDASVENAVMVDVGGSSASDSAVHEENSVARGDIETGDTTDGIGDAVDSPESLTVGQLKDGLRILIEALENQYTIQISELKRILDLFPLSGEENQRTWDKLAELAEVVSSLNAAFIDIFNKLSSIDNQAMVEDIKMEEITAAPDTAAPCSQASFIRRHCVKITIVLVGIICIVSYFRCPSVKGFVDTQMGCVQQNVLDPLAHVVKDIWGAVRDTTLSLCSRLKEIYNSPERITALENAAREEVVSMDRSGMVCSGDGMICVTEASASDTKEVVLSILKKHDLTATEGCLYGAAPVQFKDYSSFVSSNGLVVSSNGLVVSSGGSLAPSRSELLPTGIHDFLLGTPGIGHVLGGIEWGASGLLSGFHRGWRFVCHSRAATNGTIGSV